MSKEFSYLGVGRVYLGPASGKLRRVGNVSALSFEPQEDTQELRDFQNPGGGLANSVSRIQSVQMSMTMRDFIAENIALALGGEVNDVEGGSATDEEHTAHLGGLIRLERIKPESVEVTDEAGETTYVEGTDYTVNAAGVVPLEDGAISDEETVLISYEYNAQRVVEALTRTAREFRMAFDGVNEAQSGAPVVVDVWRVRFSPAENVGLITEEFGELALTGRVLRDASRGGDNLSQYFRVTQDEQ